MTKAKRPRALEDDDNASTCTKVLKTKSAEQLQFELIRKLNTTAVSLSLDLSRLAKKLGTNPLETARVQRLTELAAEVTKTANSLNDATSEQFQAKQSEFDALVVDIRKLVKTSKQL